MTWWQILTSILVAIASFVAGWLLANEKLRLEVFKKRLDIYLQLNSLAAEILTANVRATINPSGFTEVLEARIAFQKYALAHALLLSQNVVDQSGPLTRAGTEPDPEGMRIAFNGLCRAMAHDFRLREIQMINAALLSPVGFSQREKAP